MKIKKIYQGELPENKILNAQSTSQTDTYSCDYINGLSTGGGAYEIIERGETATGTYTKWADGRMEWVGSITIEQIPCDVAIGSMFRCQGNTYGNVEYGVTFIEPPILFCTTSGNYPVYLACVGKNISTTSTGYVLIVNYKNEVVWDEIFNYQAIGKWK